ncbi:MAG: endolytic transglycosylase MltG, partial [Candidatus Fimenecus sp.]
DAYDELLNAYAEEAERKRSILADVHRKDDVPQKGDVPARPNNTGARTARDSAPATRTKGERAPAVQSAPHRAPTRAEVPHSPAPQSTPRPTQNPSAPKAAAPKKPSHQTPPRAPAQGQAHHFDTAPIRPMSPAAPPSSAPSESTPNHAANFKLDIKGLDEEFQPQPAPSRARRAQPNDRAVIYTKDTPAQAHTAGAFAGFSEVVKKRRAPRQQPEAPVSPAVPVSAAPQAEIIKQRPQKLDGNAIKAFFLKNKVTWIIIGVCMAAAILLSTYTISCMNDIFAVNRDSETVVTVNIPAEANTKTVLKILQQNDLIEHRHFCSLFAKIMQFKDDNYLTGVYYVTASMGVEKMLTTFKQPTTTGETVTLTFPEGYTVDQIVQKLEKYEVCSAAALYQTMKDVDFSSEFSFIASMDNKESRYRLLEGYLYPDTYEFYVGESPSSVLRKFLNNFNKKWTDEYAAQAEKLGMSVDDVITLASIVQKEAYGAEQSPLVSSVLHNRLNKSGLYPSLQCDSTEEYINEYIKPNTQDAAQLSKFTNLYSSYKCAGLPVGSICNPGDDAIKAALYPEKTDYYFFAHDVNKKLYLARNDSERRSNNLAILNANSEAEKNKTNG